MTLRMTALASSAIACLLYLNPAKAEEPAMSVADLAQKTAIVFFKPDATAEQRSKFITNVKTFAADGDGASDEWVVVDMPPAEAREKLLMQNADVIDHIEANSVFYPFVAGCTGPTALPGSATIPPGITRMGGPLTGTVPTRKVWIIDSGVDIDYPAYFSIDFSEAALCPPAGGVCQSASSVNTHVDDELGHGTFIANIIAGKSVGGGSLVGMLPGATIVPIKITTKASPTASRAALQRATKWVLDRVDAGDVVNLSWGALVEPEDDGTGYGKMSKVEEQVRDIALKGAKVSIAAGNYDSSMAALSPTGGYVETMSPARMGGRDTSPGSIVTVSAIDPADNFWFDDSGDPKFGSFFGNGPPNYAAPGVDIESLWPGGMKNTCTGTSFAAAHVSGALLQDANNVLVSDGQAYSDPDGQGDPIANCSKGGGNSCDIVP